MKRSEQEQQEKGTGEKERGEQEEKEPGGQDRDRQEGNQEGEEDREDPGKDGDGQEQEEEAGDSPAESATGNLGKEEDSGMNKEEAMQLLEMAEGGVLYQGPLLPEGPPAGKDW